jgi:hypothetical protein
MAKAQNLRLCKVLHFLLPAAADAAAWVVCTLWETPVALHGRVITAYTAGGPGLGDCNISPGLPCCIVTRVELSIYRLECARNTCSAGFIVDGVTVMAAVLLAAANAVAGHGMWLR